MEIFAHLENIMGLNVGIFVHSDLSGYASVVGINKSISFKLQTPVIRDIRDYEALSEIWRKQIRLAIVALMSSCGHDEEDAGYAAMLVVKELPLFEAMTCSLVNMVNR